MTPSSPSITFVIPAFNAAATVVATLRSLLAQTRPDWTAIVIDDGSTDGTRHAAESVRDRRIQVIGQANAGVACARNRGLSLAQTPAITFLDADDTVEPAFIEQKLPRLAGFDLAAASYRYVDPDLRDVGWTIRLSQDEPARLTEFNQFAIGAIVFNRDSLLRLAGLCPFPSDTTQEDWSLLLNLRNAGARWAPVSDTALYSYRLRPQSRTTALCAIWRDGLNLIASHHVHGHTRQQALRRWTLRNLARAAAMCDRQLCAGFFEHLDTLTAFDVDTLTGALRWSIRRMIVAREPQAGRPIAQWRSHMLEILGSSELAREALRRALSPDWDRVAAAAAARVQPDQTLVIYGLGRNGRDLLSALQPKGVSLAVIDDGPLSPSSLPRITVTDLTPNHIVLVTPDDRSAILSTLQSGKHAQVLFPEQLVA
jgi:hypothetical protein